MDDIDVLHLIDRLEEMVGEARRLPVGGSVVLARQRLLDLVDRLRVALPAEVYQASEIIQQRDEILAQAREEAARILARAQEELERRLSETEVVRAAEARAEQILREAHERADALMREAEAQARARLDEAQALARQQMEEADAYALKALQRLEESLDQLLHQVRRGIQALERRHGWQG